MEKMDYIERSQTQQSRSHLYDKCSHIFLIRIIFKSNNMRNTNFRGKRLHISVHVLCNSVLPYIASLTTEFSLYIIVSLKNVTKVSNSNGKGKKMMKRCELVFEEARRGGCKEHPYDKQSPGVCSSCLREKLSQLYNTNPIIDPRCFSPASSPASPHQSFSSSKHGSSGHRRPRFRRNASHVAESASCMLSLNLKKSKSLAFASRHRDVMMSGRKKDGFWTKVLKLKRNDEF
ncbi:hypothetical protein JHK82_049068 [Glycine max]|nr:hypothetical protein JHK82_049068 [Glycine max]